MIGAEVLAAIGTIIFLVLDRHVKPDSVPLIVQDYLMDKDVSDEEKAELEKIVENPKYLEKSFMGEKLRPYILPFHVDFNSRD